MLRSWWPAPRARSPGTETGPSPISAADTPMDVTQSRQTDINTLPDSGFRLLTLGTLALVDERGACDQSLARRRRKLAVLTVLAVGRRPVLRERLTEMFWGDEE